MTSQQDAPIDELTDATDLATARGWEVVVTWKGYLRCMKRGRWELTISWIHEAHPTPAMRWVISAHRGPLPVDDPRRQLAHKTGRVYVHRPYHARRTCEAGELIEVLLSELRWIDHDDEV